MCGFKAERLSLPTRFGVAENMTYEPPLRRGHLPFDPHCTEAAAPLTRYSRRSGFPAGLPFAKPCTL
jgi:hypothetical protein